MPPQKEPAPEMLKNLLESIDAAAYAFDKNRKIIYVNRAAAEMLQTPDPGSGIGAAEANHFEENVYFDEAGRKLPYPEGSALELAFKGIETKDLVLEHRDLRRHTQRWIRISCKPIYDKDGAFDYGILSYRDISVRKNEEHKLKFLVESAKILSVTMDFEERLRQKAALAVPTLADWCAIDIRNADGSMTRVALVHRNPESIAYFKEYESKYPDAPGASASERVVLSGKPDFIPLLTDNIIDEAPGLTAAQRADVKKLGLTSIIVVPIGTPGNMLGALTVAYAESGRSYTQADLDFFMEFGYHLSVTLENARLYDEIRQRDQAKDQFLASLSHELRNPLAPIKSALELLHLLKPDEEILEQVHIIEHQFDHMTRLLRDLLDATRFIQGKIKLDKTPFDLVQMTTRLAKSVWPLAENAGISLEVSLPKESVMLKADATRIEQAISNVLHNAIKFTPAGGSIFIGLEAKGGVAVLRIRDSGAGITKEELVRIFEPYYQSARVSAGNRGLGIGLRLVHDIVAVHDGTVTAESEGTGKGSCFIIALPLGEAIAEA